MLVLVATRSVGPPWPMWRFQWRGYSGSSSSDPPTQQEAKQYSAVVCEEISRIHTEYAESLPSPEDFSQTEIDERVARGVANVRRQYVGLPREAEERRAQEAQELLQRIQQRNSVRFRDDLADRSRRVREKSALEKQLNKEPEKPQRSYEVVER